MLSELLLIATLAWAPGSDPSAPEFSRVEASDAGDKALARVRELTALVTGRKSAELNQKLQDALTQLESDPAFLVDVTQARTDRIAGYQALAWGYYQTDDQRVDDAIAQAHRLADPTKPIDWSSFGQLAKHIEQTDVGSSTGAIEVECEQPCEGVFVAEWPVAKNSNDVYAASQLYPGSYRVLVKTGTKSDRVLWMASIEVQQGQTAKLVWAPKRPEVTDIVTEDPATTDIVTEETTTATTTTDRSASRPARRAGIGLTIGGAATTILGLGLVIDVQTKWGQAPRDVYGLRGVYRTGWTCLGAGVVLATVGTVLWALNRKHRTQQSRWQLRGGTIAF